MTHNLKSPPAEPHLPPRICSAGEWQLFGTFNIGPDCATIRDALSRGSYHLLAPRLHDLEINGERLQVEATETHVATCHP